MKVEKRTRTRRSAVPTSSTCLRLTNATVTVTFSGNLFDLTPDEQQLIKDLTGIIKAHGEARDDKADAANLFDETRAGSAESPRRQRLRKALAARTPPVAVTVAQATE